MTQPTDAPQTVSAQHRQRMLEGLAASIREKGLAATQVSDIVRHARASRTTFYNAFADKDACFLELAEQAFLLVFRNVEAAVEPAAPWDRQIDQTIDAFIGALAADPQIALSFSSELPALGPRGVEARRAAVDRYAELLVRLTRSDAMRAAGITEISMNKAVLLMTGMDGLIVRTVGRGETIADLAPLAKEVFKAVLAAGIDPARGGSTTPD